MSVALIQTDVFKYYENDGARMSDRIKNIISNPKAATIVNEALEDVTLNRFANTFKEPIALKALTAVRAGDIVLFVAKPEFNLPECIPFFRYAQKGGKVKVAVNLSNFIVIHNESGYETYEVEDMRKLYAMLIAAYMQLMIPDPANYPIKAIEYGAKMWADVFCKVLNRSIGLSTNKDRAEAYGYFATMFYLKYMIGVPDSTATITAVSWLRGREKSQLIRMIEAKVEDQKIDMYADFTTFCHTLFNNDISGVKGLRMAAANPGEKMDVSFYLRRFVDAYGQAAIMSLAYAPYFTWMVICTQKKAYLCSIKQLGEALGGQEGTKFLAALYGTVS